MDTQPVSVFANNNLFHRYHVALQFTGKLYGGVPRDLKAIEAWVMKTFKVGMEEHFNQYLSNEIEDAAIVRQLLADKAAEASDIEKIGNAAAAYADEKHTNGFKRDAVTGRPYIGDFQIKAMLKEAVNICFPWDQGKNKWKGKTPRSLFAEYVFVDQSRIFVGDDIDNVDLCIGHIKTAKGPLSTLTYVEYVEGARIEFDLSVKDGFIQDDWWATIWPYAERNGLGARRSQSAGQFVVTAWDEIKGSKATRQSTNGRVHDAVLVG